MLKLVIRHDEPRDDEAEDECEDDADAVTRAFPRLTLELFHDDGSRRRWRLFYEGAEAQTVAFDTEASEVGEIVAQPSQSAARVACLPTRDPCRAIAIDRGPLVVVGSRRSSTNSGAPDAARSRARPNSTSAR